MCKAVFGGIAKPAKVVNEQKTAERAILHNMNRPIIRHAHVPMNVRQCGLSSCGVIGLRLPTCRIIHS